MDKFKNITLIGTSHISIESINQISDFINKNKPEIIALELDKKRFYGLLNKTKLSFKDLVKLGVKAFLFNLIGAYIEKKLGKLVGVSPGDEMLTAVKLSKEFNLKLKLIDQNIEITLKRLIKKFTWKEKFRLILDIIKGLIFRKPLIKPFDLRKVPPKKTIRKLIRLVKKRYPSVYKVLIKERNEVMAKHLKYLMFNYKESNILAIVGAGHEDGIIEILKRD
ncbi:MAG: TraB/GumN family protein [Nanoarchaeota archaeon]|nr:TraB/GumN family protein [Nanoarchaeota archaeon]